MELKFLKSVLEFLSERGMIAIPLITLLLLLVVVGIISSRDKLYQWLGRRVYVRVMIRSQEDLKYHSLFIREPKYELLVQNSKFGTPVKDKVFRFILMARLHSTIDNTKTLVTESQLSDIQPGKLQYLLQENSRRIVEQYNKNIRKYLEQEYGPVVGEELYEYIMNSAPSGFNTIYDSQIVHIDQLTEFLCRQNSAIFKNNVDRLEIYLHELNSLLYLGITDAENMFRGFNGNLEKIVDDYGRARQGSFIHSGG